MLNTVKSVVLSLPLAVAVFAGLIRPEYLFSGLVRLVNLLDRVMLHHTVETIMNYRNKLYNIYRQTNYYT